MTRRRWEAVMPPADYSSEENDLVRLLCARLRKVLWGTLSLGLTGCLTGIPDPRRFFQEQEEHLRAVVKVLHHTTAVPGASASITVLRRSSDRLKVLIQELFYVLAVLSQCKTNAPADNQRVAARLVTLDRDVQETLTSMLQEVNGTTSPAGKEWPSVQTLVGQFLTALELTPQTT
jgi:hypothetical protein